MKRYISAAAIAICVFGSLALAQEADSSAVPVEQIKSDTPDARSAVTYEVGPGKALERIAEVPWEALEAGDTVKIHWRADGYREKFVICGIGTPEQPITVSGVPGPGGELPVLDGRDAVTREGLSFNNEGRSVIQIGPLRGGEETPAHIVVENLELRSSRKPYTFTNSAGEKETYTNNASCVRFNVGDNITLRNCVIRDSGNGTLSSSSTSNITIEGCYYVDNGLDESDDHSEGVHQTYTNAAGIIYQYNHFTPLRKGCLGSNLKDRSAGNIIRYNWIEGGTKQIDLPDSGRINDPTYRETFIYGNILIEPEGDGLPEMVTYGGDMGRPERYRKGTLYFYNNTVISHRTDEWFLIKLKTADEKADVRNNIIYAAGGPGELCAMSGWHGTMTMSHNWLKPGYKDSHFGDEFEGEVIDDGTSVTGDAPGFVDFAAQDFHLVPGSACVDAGTDLAPATLDRHEVRFQYVKHRAIEPRATDERIDLGAYELTREE